MPKIRIEVEYDVTERLDVHEKYGSADWLRKSLEETFARSEGSVLDDYGKDADGGYDGAFITAGRIIRSTVTPTQ